MIELRDVPTGIISDTHFPGNIDGALDFVLQVGKEFGVEQWVHIGDVFDHHYMSRHPNELDAYNPIDEYLRAKAEVQKWVQVIPELTLLYGNHDRIPERQAEILGIPTLFLRDLNSVYDLPDTWVWDYSASIYNTVLIEHGLGSGGMYGCKNTANKLGAGYIQGHTHSHAGVFNLPRQFGDTMAMNVGCLIDADKYNARYGKLIYKTPLSLGMGVITAPDQMYFIKYK